MPKHCAYCGLSLEDFILYGRLGCEFCLDFLGKHPLIFQKVVAKIPHSSYHFHSIPKLPQEILSSNHIPQNCQWSIRYRIARNLKKEIFPILNTDKNKAIELIQKNFPNIKDFQTWKDSNESKFAKKNILKANFIYREDIVVNFFLGDEDGIRCEFLFKGEGLPDPSILLPDFPGKLEILSFLNQRTYFSYAKGWGFLNSCPTNSIRGDRVSFQMQYPIEFSKDRSRDLHQAQQASSQWNWEENSISFAVNSSNGGVVKTMFSVKNFSKKRKNHFLALLNSIVF